MIGAELLAVTGAAASGSASLKYDFDTVSANLPADAEHETRSPRRWPSLLFLVGFGIKMGMWPFGQFWLPDAHPAAPSPVSAMLSGVMIKTGVYGLMRYFLWLVPPAGAGRLPAGEVGLASVALLGTITLFTGTMQALKQEQSKRLLAFHSIGQIGYILLGTGACMSLLPATGAQRQGARRDRPLRRAAPRPQPRAVQGPAVPQRRLHAACATGTQDLNKMGGLMRYMPLTGRHGNRGLLLDLRRAAVQWLRQQVDHLRGGRAGEPRRLVSRGVRGHCHPDQRADPGLVHQVLRGELPLAGAARW